MKNFMTVLGRFSLAALISLSLAGCPAPEEVGGLELGIKLNAEKWSLSNGLQIVLIEDHTIPIVSFQTWYNVGSVDERPGLTGISHLFEHLMFKGTTKYGPKKFFTELEAKGAEVNAYTTRDYTVYHETFVPDLLEKVIDMESDRMTGLILDQSILDTERQVVFEERRMRTESSPDGRMQEALWKMSFKSHPYSWPTIGTPEDLNRISVIDLTQFYALHYQPGNAVIVVVGDFSMDQTKKWIKSAYSSIPGRKRLPRNIFKEYEQKEERLIQLEDQSQSNRFIIGYKVPSGLEEDAYILDVLTSILFEGTSSRVYQELVETKQLLLGIAGSNYTPSYPGLLIIGGALKEGVSFEYFDQSLEMLFDRVRQEDVGVEELERAKRQLTMQVIDGVRTAHGLGQLVGLVTTVFNDPYRFVKDVSKYMKVQPQELRRVAQKYLIKNNRNIVRMVPAKPNSAQGAFGTKRSK